MEHFQERILLWMRRVFPEAVRTNKQERALRFLEESLELCQSAGLTVDQVSTMRDYVYSRPVGDAGQEVGGVMVTLTALCSNLSLSLHGCAEVELARISEPSMIEKIQKKQVSKELFGITGDHSIPA